MHYIPEIYDLKLISINNKYETEYFFPELIVQYGHNEIIKCDYSDPIFEDVYQQVLTTYEQEKDKKDIIVFGNLTGKPIGKYHYDLNGLEQDSNTVNIIDTKWGLYLKECLITILEFLTPDSKFKIDHFDIRKNKMMVYYLENGEKKVFPIICNQSANILTFKLSYLNGMAIPISGRIEINNSVVITWVTPNELIKGTIIYSFTPEENINIVTGRDETVSLKNNLNLEEEEKHMVNQYLELSELPEPSKLVKIGENSYMFLSLESLSQGYNLIVGHLIINENQIIIDYKEQFGLSSFEEYLFVPLDGYNAHVTINRQDASVIKRFMETEVCTSFYRNKVLNKCYRSLVNREEEEKCRLKQKKI